MKIGDLIAYQSGPWDNRKTNDIVGTVLDFPPATHPKEFQKVRVLTGGEIQHWIKQFCKVVQSAPDNHLH